MPLRYIQWVRHTHRAARRTDPEHTMTATTQTPADIIANMIRTVEQNIIDITNMMSEAEPAACVIRTSDQLYVTRIDARQVTVGGILCAKQFTSWYTMQKALDRRIVNGRGERATGTTLMAALSQEAQTQRGVLTTLRAFAEGK